jgi:hypothetical protein
VTQELVEDIYKTLEELQDQTPFKELVACFDSLQSNGRSARDGDDEVYNDADSDEESQDDESEDNSEDHKYRRIYEQRLLKEARLAEIRCEMTTIREVLQKRAIHVPMIAISARQYQRCKERNPDSAPILDIDATGIPALRQTMYRLPALNNLVTLRDHVSLTLPAIFDNVKHLMVKFTEDDGHAQIRETLDCMIPSLQASLTTGLDPMIHNHVLQPWNLSQQNASILPSINAQLTFCNLHYQSFCKMLREDGRPRSGVALGYDLNQMIHRSMVDDLEKWKRSMTLVIPKVCENLMRPIMDFVASMGEQFNRPSGDPGLKLAIKNAYLLMRRRMDQEYSVFEIAVKRNLDDTHFKFWSATSLYDPIIKIMRPVYHDTLLEYHRQPGRGVYERQKAHIKGLVLGPRYPNVPLPVKFADDLVSSQVASWKIAGTTFIASATARLQDFAQVMQNIVDVEFSGTAEHETVVERLESVLLGLESTLARLQDQIPKPEEKRGSGCNPKRSRSTRSASSIPPWSSQFRLQTPQIKPETEAGFQMPMTEGYSRDVPIAIDCGSDDG